MLNHNDKAPNFSLIDQNGVMHTLSDYAGKYVLVYFYPKDDTPGCTKEACALRDLYKDFEKMGVVVFGISKDSPESHKKFVQKYELPFRLLSDPEKKTIEDYHTRGTISTKRISYLIDPKGNIAKAYLNVDPASHAAEILADLKALVAS